MSCSVVERRMADISGTVLLVLKAGQIVCQLGNDAYIDCHKSLHRRCLMATIEKISAGKARRRVKENLSILVCIYDDEKFKRQAHLKGAIPMSEFLKMKPDLAQDTEIIFY